MRLAKNQLAVLRLLAEVKGEEELAGVEVADRLPDVGRSSVYAALAALQRDGMLTARWVTGESYPRRLMKISALGEQALATAERKVISGRLVLGTQGGS